jgi:hypothetical protein
MLVPEGARPAMSKIFWMISRGTGFGIKARMLRRPVMASSTLSMIGGFHSESGTLKPRWKRAVADKP